MPERTMTPDVPLRRFANACWWLLRALNHEEIMSVLVNSARELSGADAVLFARREGDELRVTASSGLSNRDVAHRWSAPCGAGRHGLGDRLRRHHRGGGSRRRPPDQRGKGDFRGRRSALGDGSSSPGADGGHRGAVPFAAFDRRTEPVAHRGPRAPGPAGGEPRRRDRFRAPAPRHEGGGGNGGGAPPDRRPSRPRRPRRCIEAGPQWGPPAGRGTPGSNGGPGRPGRHRPHRSGSRRRGADRRRTAPAAAGGRRRGGQHPTGPTARPSSTTLALRRARRTQPLCQRHRPGAPPPALGPRDRRTPRVRLLP